jgi:hypothetical protein
MKIIVNFLIIVNCWVSISCERNTNSFPAYDEVRQGNLLAINQKSFEKPSGNEIKIAVSRKAFDEYEIAITNISKKPVFCGYLPGRNSNYADFFAYGVEWRSSKSEAFMPEYHGGDFAPPAVAIDSEQTVRTMFYPSKSGEYQVLFGYAVDPEVAKTLNGVPFDERSQDINSKMNEAFTTAISKGFKVAALKRNKFLSTVDAKGK